VTVRKEGRFNPADRLEATNVKIKLDNARFESWDTLATAYTTVNAGTVQLTQTRGLTESLTAGAPSTAPASVSATVTGNQSNTKVENYTATNQTETLTATIEDEGRALVIYRQGGAGIDLTGNTVIKVTISYIGSSPMFTHVFFVDKYKDKKMKWLSPNKLSVADKPVLAVPPGNAIPAQIILIYTLRHVESGDSTYEERDDKVIEFTASPVMKMVTLVPEREVSPRMFGLVATAGAFSGFAVNIKERGAPPVGLCFDSYNEVREFLTYLNAVHSKHPAEIGGGSRLGFLVPPSAFSGLTASDVPALEARDKCM
jgi:hypothetical protein